MPTHPQEPQRPHFAPVFEFNAKGESKVVEQDSELDLVARAKNVLVCSVGFREELPEFGIPQLLFQTVPLNLSAVQAQVSRWAEIDATATEGARSVLETAAREVRVQVS